MSRSSVLAAVGSARVGARSSHGAILLGVLLAGLAGPGRARAATPPPMEPARPEDAKARVTGRDTKVMPPMAAAPDAARPPPAAAAPDAKRRAAQQAKRYARALRQKIKQIRPKVVGKIKDKLAARQEARMLAVADVLGYIALGGVLLLFVPLLLRRRYPGKGGVMFKYSLVAAFTFFVAIFLFTLVLLALRSVQSLLAARVNPQVALVNGAMDALAENADEIAEVGPVLIEPPLQAMEAGRTDSPLLALLSSMQHLMGAVKKDIAVFKTLGRFFRGLNWIFAYIPIFLTLVAVVLFLLSLKPIIVDIVTLPARAAAGEALGAKSVIVAVLRRVGREGLATLCLIVILVGVTLLSGFLLSLVMKPAVDAFMGYLFASLIYLLAEKDASTFWVYVSLGGTVLFLLANVLIILVAGVIYLGKAQRILRRRFHDKVALAAHKRFWLWSTLGLLWALTLPYLYILGAQPLVELVIDKLTAGKSINWVALLVSGPAILFLCFLLVFWAAQGVRGIKHIVRYNPEATKEDDAAAAAESVEAAARVG